MMKRFFYWKWLMVGVFALYVSAASAQVKKDNSASESASAEKLAAVEQSQAAMETRLAEMQEKLAAAEKDKKTVEDLNRQVQELNQKLDATTAETKAINEETKKEIASFAPGKGFVIKGPGESSLTIAGLLQTRMETAKDASPDADNWDWESYIRRMRLMFYGQINKWINFFVETDQPNLGKGGAAGADWKAPMFIQDAYLEVNVHKAFQIDLGIMVAPFSHHGMQGATSLMGIDYHSMLIKYPAGSNLVWRDAGLMLRGLFAADHIEYRLAAFNGVRGYVTEAATDYRNPNDLIRMTGRLTFNVFEAEGGAGAGGMFYDGLYLAKTDDGITSPKRILSFGASADWQPDLNVELDDTGAVEDRTDYIAAAWDVFLDMPLGAKKIMSLNGQVNGYYYNYGDRRTDEGIWNYNAIADATSYTGLGLSSEFGFRYNWLQPIVLVDFFNATKADGDTGDYIAMYGGFNTFPFGHATTFKIQAGAENKNGVKEDGSLKWTPSVKFQAQLLF